MNVTEYMSQLKVITKCHKIFFTNSYLKFFSLHMQLKKRNYQDFDQVYLLLHKS